MSSVPPLDSFKFVRRIAYGGFGIVEEAIDLNGVKVAIKKERSSRRITRSSVAHEYSLYNVLAGHPCIPRVVTHGKYGNFQILVMELLGPSLGDRFRQCGKRFSLKTTVMLGLGMLNALEYIHSRGVIHRDLKPDNFLFSRSEAQSHSIYLVDFGLARRYRNPHTGVHFAYSDGLPLMGTLTYASPGNHLGQAQSRRDDLQSFAYIILEFLRGSLPWQNLRGGTDRHREWRTREKKSSWTAERLCNGLPKELEVFTDHCMTLGWDEDPRYDVLREALVAIMARERWVHDHRYDWDPQMSPVLLEPPAPIVEEQPRPPPVRPGDLVFVRLLTRQSLEHEAPPSIVDPSYYHHPDLSTDEWQFPFRPAVVRRVHLGPVTFKIDVYPIMRRDALKKISSHRKNLSFPLTAVSTSTPERQLAPENIFIYRPCIGTSFYVQYEQARSVNAQWSVNENTLVEVETVLQSTGCPYGTFYDSDDENTRVIQSSMPRAWLGGAFVAELTPLILDDLPIDGSDVVWEGLCGWISDMVAIDHKRREENGDLSSDDSDTDSELSWFDGPRPSNRRPSCTLDHRD